ncbi:hypothetical protein JW906_03555, partial [bacterium]|nr:hypothetical protein [bacterium]
GDGTGKHQHRQQAPDPIPVVPFHVSPLLIYEWKLCPSSQEKMDESGSALLPHSRPPVKRAR